MKHIISCIALVSILLLGSCSSSKNSQEGGSVNISGTVSEIQPGKDGYTARIVTADNQTYFVTISHSNLTTPDQYKTVKPGEMVKVKGDFFKVGEENHITVRELN